MRVIDWVWDCVGRCTVCVIHWGRRCLQQVHTPSLTVRVSGLVAECVVTVSEFPFFFVFVSVCKVGSDGLSGTPRVRQSATRFYNASTLCTTMIR